MKYFIESTWAPWAPLPATIEGVHAIGKASQAPAPILEKINQAVEQGLFSMDPHPWDYLVVNDDMTKSVGFYQTDKSKAEQWVAWRQQNLSPGQLTSQLVAKTDPGDDPLLEVHSYGQKLRLGLIAPYTD